MENGVHHQEFLENKVNIDNCIYGHVPFGTGNDLSNTLYFLYSKENIGSIVNYKSAIDGIIFLSSFPCGPDSLVNELVIRKVDDMPIINLILDESTSTSGLYTRLESFIDIVKARQDNE